MKKEFELHLFPSGKEPEEALPRLLRIKEFESLNIFNHFDQTSNAICIYCSGWGRTYGTTIHLETEIPFNQESMFFDWNGGALTFYSESKGIRFLSQRGYLIGYFKPEIKMLVLSDITHKDSYVSYAEKVLHEILGILEKAGYKPKKIFKKGKVKKMKLLSLGADPEFALRDEYGEVKTAEHYYSSLEKHIGCDGSGDQLELRPDPGSPREVVKSLKELLGEVSKKFDVGYSESYSYGGHIHFGYGFPVEPSSSFLEALDDFLGERTRFLLKRHGYGDLSDYETKKWGFEYRTPSAAIFANPEIAKISLKIAKLIGEKAGKNQVIEYNSPPEKEDYVKLGLTEKQAEYFLDFTKGDKVFPSILGFWGIKRRHHIFIRFNDEWKFWVKDKIERKLNEDFPKLKMDVKLGLFGLSKDRGEVNTIPVDGYGVIEHEKAHKDFIGIAYSLRMGEGDLDILIKSLEEVIKCALL